MQADSARMNAAVSGFVARSHARTAALRNFGWLMTDKALAVVFGLAVFGLIARYYGPAGSGHYAYALALLQSALGLSLVCSASALLPRLCRLRSGVGATLANVFVVRLAGSLCAAVVTAIFAVATISDPQRLLIALIMLFAVPLIEPFYTAVVFWQSRNDNRPPTVSRASGLIARAGVVLVAISLNAPLWVLAFAWVLEALTSASLQVASLKPVGKLRDLAKRVSVQRARAYLRFGVRFLLGLWLANLFIRLDRLVLGGLLPAQEFGIYASAMQLVDVWLQVAYLTGFAVGPAFLYESLAKARPPWTHWRVGMTLAGIGVAGLVVAALFGEAALHLIFGEAFVGGYPFLVAGTAFGVLLFVDQIVQMKVTASNRPLALAIKWGSACLAALAVQISMYGSWGAYAGPAGLAVGVVIGWIAVWATFRASPQTTATNGARP